MRGVTLFLTLLVCSLAQAQASAPLYYVKVDSRWYEVVSGSVAIEAGGDLIDVPGTILPSTCTRMGGGLPPFGDNTALLGSAVFDVLYSDEPFRFHATQPPVVEIRTPSGDVVCGQGVTPPDSVVDRVVNPPSALDLFSDGFEAS